MICAASPGMGASFWTMKKNILILLSRLKLKSTYEPKFKKTNVVFAEMCQNARDNFFSPNQGENLFGAHKNTYMRGVFRIKCAGRNNFKKRISLEDHLF
jgi:hypothetical protein